MMNFTNRALAFLLALLFLAPAAPCLADPWPQWRGIHRDGKSAEIGLLKEWPKEGPPLVWKVNTLGEGYSTPSVVGGKIYGASYRGADEFAWTLDEKDGSTIWETRISPAAREKIGYAHGPRSTPTVDGKDVFTLGAAGHLTCLDADTGSVRWQTHLKEDFGGEMMSRWGYSESVLVDGDRVVCTPGGEKGAVVCLNRQTGRPMWRARQLRDPAAYTSIIKTTIHGIEQYISLTGKTLAGIDPSTGKLLWKIERKGKTAVIPTPICRGNQIFVTSGYGIGCNLFEIEWKNGQFSAKENYANKEVKNHHGGVIRIGDYLYASNDLTIVCLEMATGEVAWEERSVGKGSLAYADGHLYLRSERGPIALIEANPEKYMEKGRFEQPDRSRRRSWPHPVIANGHLFLRDQNQLFCYDITLPTSARVNIARESDAISAFFIQAVGGAEKLYGVATRKQEIVGWRNPQ